VTNYVLGEKTRSLLTVEKEFPKLLRLGPQALLIHLIRQGLSALMSVLKLTVITAIIIYDNDEYNSPFQLNYSLVAWGINSSDKKNNIYINNKKYAPIQTIPNGI
jgi:hypothetical protein